MTDKSSGTAVNDAPPKTIGELRKRLEALGNPWQPDPTLSDDEPIPVYPTGGDRTDLPVGEQLGDRSVEELLERKGIAPSRAELRDVWRKAGVQVGGWSDDVRSGRGEG